jgi:hypothetical protein
MMARRFMWNDQVVERSAILVNIFMTAMAGEADHLQKRSPSLAAPTLSCVLIVTRGALVR